MEQALFSNGESEVVRIGMKKKIKGGGVEKGEGWEGESIFSSSHLTPLYYKSTNLPWNQFLICLNSLLVWTSKMLESIHSPPKKVLLFAPQNMPALQANMFPDMHTYI